MLGLGIDIGTTTLSFVVIDSENGKVVDKRTLSNDYKPAGCEAWEKLQDPVGILQAVEKTVAEMREKYPSIGCIGVTGQMHGILYVDEDGQAVSSLYTWQDERGNKLCSDVTEGCGAETYAQRITRITGFHVATGYGLTTHYYNVCNGLVPEKAVSLCTIGDYIGMRLADRKTPLLHVSNAASLGIFDLHNTCFDQAAMKKLDMDVAILPEVTAAFDKVGTTEGDLAVGVAIGDNQASFIGSVPDVNNSLLVNVGTGSQISMASDRYVLRGEVETRPLCTGSQLLVGSSLCGGRAYALLNQFFAKTAKMLGVTVDTDQIYGAIAEALKERENQKPAAETLQFSTKFCGSRSDVSQRAAITNLGLDNFTPEDFAEANLQGIVNELYDMYADMVKDSQDAEESKRYLVGSGNAIRKNRVLRQLFEQKFGGKLLIPAHQEEAAYGSVLTAFIAAGEFQNMKEAQRIIKMDYSDMVKGPVFFERNRVSRVYKGGKLFADFFGDAPEDNNYPEEWIASSVMAINKNQESEKEGISKIRGAEVYFDELIADYKAEMLGDRKELGVLVKILDSAIRLPVQAHPDKPYSNKYFNSDYGKAEMWIVLGTRENACLYFGFKDKLTKEEFAEKVEESIANKEVMAECLNVIPAKKGDVFFVPAKMVHAIGYGCLILEVQEPTDFTIQPEAWCGDYRLNDKEMYLGLTKDQALDCFDYDVYADAAVSLARKIPAVILEEDGVRVEKIVDCEDTPCFSANKITVSGGSYRISKAPGVYIVTEGAGAVTCDNGTYPLKKGDYFFVPYAANNLCVLTAQQGNDGCGSLEVIECLPPVL